MKAVLYTDGGARGNPGPAGTGAVLETESGSRRELSSFLGKATNNQAEYRALLSGLALAKRQGVTELECYLDSELLVKQMKGEYKVKDSDLQLLYREAQHFSKQFEVITFTHIPREKNKEADRLVNEVLDKHIPARGGYSEDGL